jgi:pimeloyl-ACP methyl ester carboxylesterase
VPARRSTAILLALAVALVAAPAAPAATAADAPTKVARVGKMKIGYRSFGAGRPVVFVMGLGGAMDGWDPTFLDAVASAGHRVVLLDNEGVGRTTLRRGTLTIGRMADDTAALIAKLRLRRPDLVGWSMGGMIAQSLAVRHPKSLRRLALLATAPGDGKATAPGPDALALLTGTSSDPLALLHMLFPPDQSAALDSYVSHIAQRPNFSGLAPAAIVARQVRASSTWLLGYDPDGRRLAKLRTRTLVGGGEQDQLLPIANQRHLAELIPHATLVTYPDAAHGFFMQHADDFAARLATFLAA